MKRPRLNVRYCPEIYLDYAEQEISTRVEDLRVQNWTRDLTNIIMDANHSSAKIDYEHAIDSSRFLQQDVSCLSLDQVTKYWLQRLTFLWYCSERRIISLNWQGPKPYNQHSGLSLFMTIFPHNSTLHRLSVETASVYNPLTTLTDQVKTYLTLHFRLQSQRKTFCLRLPWLHATFLS